MRLWTAIILFSVCGLFTGVALYSKIEVLHQLDDASLIFEYEKLSSLYSGASYLGKLEYYFVSFEKIRRDINLDSIIWALFSVACLLLASKYIFPKFQKQFQKKKKVSHSLSIKELPTKEIYTDEYTYNRKKETGFQSRHEAVLFLENDVSRVCEYCGNWMIPFHEARPDSISQITYYKEVPEGAKDLRIVLGYLWLVYPTPELQCTSCKKILKR